MNAEKTFWNGEPVAAAKVNVVVGGSPPTWWCHALKGKERKAVRVETKASKFYLDDEDGSGWAKVTVGLGSPRWGHRSVPVEREVDR